MWTERNGMEHVMQYWAEAIATDSNWAISSESPGITNSSERLSDEEGCETRVEGWLALKNMWPLGVHQPLVIGAHICRSRKQDFLGGKWWRPSSMAIKVKLVKTIVCVQCLWFFLKVIQRTTYHGPNSQPDTKMGRAHKRSNSYKAYQHTVPRHTTCTIKAKTDTATSSSPMQG